jgi:ABC-type multidrug transport system ATPase subunit
LAADSITCRLGDRFALSDVYLRIETGEIVGLVGRNGSGKTTLLRLLLGHSGRGLGVVKVDSIFVPPSQRWRHIAFLPQQSFLPRDCTVRQAGRLFLGPQSESVLRADARTLDLLQRRIGDLSSGERRYVEFLLVLGLNRSFVFLDEPFSQIEPLYVELMSQALRRRKESAFLVTDHNYRSVRDVSTRLLSLAGGRLAAVGSTDQELREAGYLP